MAKHSALVATACVSALLLALNLPAQTTDEAAQTVGVSKVRIVRLSEVKGLVQLDRNNGRGYEPATANLPIVEGSKLQTGQGVARVCGQQHPPDRPDSPWNFRSWNVAPMEQPFVGSPGGAWPKLTIGKAKPKSSTCLRRAKVSCRLQPRSPAVGGRKRGARCLTTICG
jgi:hypothetical protein